jgi:phage/conjugal plasmid C-4 type zinc finger TraR family protein
MDDVDYASEREQRELERRIKSIQGSLNTNRDANGDVRCEDCDEIIPPARIAAMPSARRCIPCQTSSER